jgi:hypothetical protein
VILVKGKFLQIIGREKILNMGTFYKIKWGDAVWKNKGLSDDFDGSTILVSREALVEAGFSRILTAVDKTVEGAIRDVIDWNRSRGKEDKDRDPYNLTMSNPQFVTVTDFLRDLRVDGLVKTVKAGVQLILLVVFLCYTATTTIIFRVLRGCDKLDEKYQGSRRYMYDDYNTSCKTDFYASNRAYAWICLLLFSVGVPLISIIALMPFRKILNPSLKSHQKAKSIQFGLHLGKIGARQHSTSTTSTRKWSCGRNSL